MVANNDNIIREKNRMNPLKTVAGTIIGGVVLAVILVLATRGMHVVTMTSIIIWLHVLAGIT